MSIEQIFNKLSDSQKQAVLRLHETGGDITTFTGIEPGLKDEVTQALKLALSRGLGGLEMVASGLKRACGEDPREFATSKIIPIVYALSEKKAPTPLGYNDMALIFAIAQRTNADGQFSAEYFAEYFSSNPFASSISTNISFDLNAQKVAEYLSELDRALLIKGDNSNFTMDERIAKQLSEQTHTLRSDSVPAYLIVGIHRYTANRM